MTLKIGFSPCPNDTYIFDALVNRGTDDSDIEFDLVMEDVQTLNEMVMKGMLDVSKISFGALPLVLDRYILLNSGAALGKGTGPLLIGPFAVPETAIDKSQVAIPGKHTTAHILFSLAYPDAVNKTFMRYDQIERFVEENMIMRDDDSGIRVGVIIHENRFTYEKRGLVKLMDLGDYWEKETHLPIPLGGIVAKRTLPHAVVRKTEDLIRKSLQRSIDKGDTLSPFVTSNAREMDAQVMRQHIGLYVNDFTRDLGITGREAVKKFVQVHSAINKLPVNLDDIFFSPS